MKTLSHKIKNALRAFTLIELLISIGIVAALSTITILILNPVEIFRQTRDANRLASLDSLRRAITIMQTEKGFTSHIGTSSVLYVSLPDDTDIVPPLNDCSGISMALPALPLGWTYHCVTTNTLAKGNGTGWLPVDLRDAGLAVLPLDPLNTLNTSAPLQSHFYIYATDGLGHFEVDVKMESTKYGLGG